MARSEVHTTSPGPPSLHIDAIVDVLAHKAYFPNSNKSDEPSETAVSLNDLAQVLQLLAVIPNIKAGSIEVHCALRHEWQWLPELLRQIVSNMQQTGTEFHWEEGTGIEGALDRSEAMTMADFNHRYIRPLPVAPPPTAGLPTGFRVGIHKRRVPDQLRYLESLMDPSVITKVTFS